MTVEGYRVVCTSKHGYGGVTDPNQCMSLSLENNIYTAFDPILRRSGSRASKISSSIELRVRKR